jgi:hypothetical protein
VTTFSRTDDHLRCRVRLFVIREAVADMLELIHAGGLIPATDDPALIDRCVEVVDRLTHATAPATPQTLLNITKD